jgi:hypothetical protein
VFKILKFTVAAIIISIILSIPAAVFLIRFENKTALGRSLKDKVIKFPKLVSLLNLNEPGDARFVYLDPERKQINVNIYLVNKALPDERINTWISEIVSETVGKKTIISDLEDINYENKGMLSNNDLNNIRKMIVSEGRAASDLNLVYVSLYAEKPTSVGLVLHRDMIFLFRDAFANLTEKGYINDVLEKTTLMHEWGHLLGVDHIDDDRCIMSEIVEVFDNPPIGKSLPKKYCWEELEDIRKIKKEIL